MDFETADLDAVLSGRSDWIDGEGAERLAEHPLQSLETEFPHAHHELEGPGEVERPSERHPVFYGCYDWHSSVHSHWALVRQLRLFDDHLVAEAIVESIDERLTPDNVEQEVTYLDEHPSFEKPYGWAWLLHLGAELQRWDDPRARRWHSALEPLEELVVDRVESALLTQDRPFRVGTHQNTAFALHCTLDYARSTGRESTEEAVVDAAERLFGHDRDYPVEYEPLGWDFLSPALTEADLMRRVSDSRAFEEWLETFLPDVTTDPYDAILSPAEVSADPDEGVALHLVGLNLAKAWCAAGIAEALEGHRYETPLRRAAEDHAERGLAQAFTDDYAGAHWLSSFALYLLTRNEEGIAPESG